MYIYYKPTFLVILSRFVPVCNYATNTIRVITTAITALFNNRV